MPVWFVLSVQSLYITSSPAAEPHLHHLFSLLTFCHCIKGLPSEALSSAAQSYNNIILSSFTVRK